MKEYRDTVGFAMSTWRKVKQVPSLGIYRHFVWLGEAEGGFPAP